MRLYTMRMISFALGLIFLYMSAWFVVSKMLNRNDLADIAWGLGFVMLSWTLYYIRPSVQLSLAVILVTIWGIRLSVHILMRNRKKSEDFRYKQWRKQWGKWFTLRSFLQVFMLQGFLLVLISAPLIAMSASGQDSIGRMVLVGLPIWCIGFFFEAMGDYELSKFIQNPKNKGRIIQQGLWKYSRHPNYFGEVLQWWGIWLIAYGTEWFALAAIGPLVITLLILKVSGIPLLEKKYANNEEYQEYAARTSKFFPLPPKKVSR